VQVRGSIEYAQNRGVAPSARPSPRTRGEGAASGSRRRVVALDRPWHECETRRRRQVVI